MFSNVDMCRIGLISWHEMEETSNGHLVKRKQIVVVFRVEISHVSAIACDYRCSVTIRMQILFIFRSRQCGMLKRTHPTHINTTVKAFK